MRRVTAEVAGGTAVLEPDPQAGAAATLWVDGAAQSHVDLADPENLVFEYIQHMAAVLDGVLPPGRVTAVHLGGAGCTLPRYLAATRPGSRQRVAETDGPLVELVRAELPIPPGAHIRISTVDGRDLIEKLARTEPNAADVVVIDVFTHAHVPAHLTTAEFFTVVAQVLRPSGVVVHNLVDGRDLAYARAVAATARSVFADVALSAEPAVWRGRRYANLVLTASASTLPIPALTRRLAGGMFPARLVHGAELARFSAGARIATDAEPLQSPALPPNALTDGR